MLPDGTRLDDVTAWRFLVAADPDILAELPEAYGARHARRASRT
jgi:hypothetical protein